MRFSVIFRWILAAASLVVCVKQMRLALKMQSYAAAVPLLFGFGCLIVAILLISPETVLRFCGWLGDMFTEVFLPGERLSKPPLSYVLARHYSRQRRYPEAVAEYEKILSYYPKERDAYFELVAVAREAEDEALARKYIRRFERKFRTGFPEGAASPPMLDESPAADDAS